MTTSQAWPVDYDPFAGQIPQRLNSFAVPVGYDPFQINDPSKPPERPIYSTNLDPSMHSFYPLPQGDPNAVPVGRGPDPDYLSVGPQGRPMTPQGLPEPFSSIRNLAGDAVQGAAGSAWQAATLPGRYLEGEQIDPVAEGLNFAGAVTMPSLGRAAMVGVPVRDLMSMSGATQGGERVLGAAVKADDGAIFRGPTHLHARDAGEAAGQRVANLSDQGFVTSTGRFVSREEANAIALENEQIALPEYSTGKLTARQLKSDYGGMLAHEPPSITAYHGSPPGTPANDPNLFGGQREGTYRNATTDQTFKKYVDKDTVIKDYDGWRTREQPNGYAAAREASMGGKTTVVVGLRGKRELFHDGERIASDITPVMLKPVDFDPFAQ